jgi:hypothetical protein
MQDFIQKSGEDVAIVIYDSPLPPKYFRLTKKFIRTTFIVVPIFVSFLIISFFYWGLSGRIKEGPSLSLPTVITESDDKVGSLEADIKSLQESNKELSEKLAAGPAVTTAEDPFLMVIKKPYGMQNFLSANKVTLDQFEFIHDKEKVNLKFQIISSSPETKVTGHVLVFMVSESGLLAYPAAANSLIAQGVKYSAGEPFSVSRLRPTNAEFSHSLTGESTKFIIYIFSREGDLLLIRETESFKVGAK